MRITDIMSLGRETRVYGDESVIVGKTDSKSPLFRQHFEDISRENAHQVLQELIAEIDVKGKELFEKADVFALRKYKELVSLYMSEAVKYSYDFSKDSTFDMRGRPKFYASINMVNDKLEALTREVLEGQKDNLMILSHIDDIRGLLLDIYL